tara:strand:- start:508 stop:735 length:228 start_codon:yes stop_codon:yes gene_type:complete
VTDPSEKDFNFEESLKELEDIVSSSEEGSNSLEDMIKNFERGVKLLSNCRSKLDSAELQIEQATKDSRVTSLDDA